MTRIRQREPQWLTTSIKLYIRKRKRAYRKAKRSNLPNDWKNFKMLCNKKNGKRKVQGVPQSQNAALPRPQEEEETDKSKQAQTEQTYEKH